MADFNSSLPIRTEQNGDVAVKVVDATTPSQGLAVDVEGKVGAKVSDAAGNALTSQANGSQRALDVGIDVAGVQVDPRQVRALTASDVVTAAQGTAAAAAGGWPVKPTDGTNSQGYTAAGEAKISVTQPLPAGTNAIGTVTAKLDDGTGNAITSTGGRLDVGLPSNKATGTAVPAQADMVGGTDGTNLKALSVDTNGKLKVDLFDATGTAFSGTNPLPVSIAATEAGTEVNDFKNATAIAAAASDNHDYTITATKTFVGKKFWASASGKMKAEVQVSADGTTFSTKWVGFSSSANPNISIDLGVFSVSDSGTGSKIRMICTNLDNQAQNLYSTISGIEQ